jgi:hypothetical protein
MFKVLRAATHLSHNLPLRELATKKVCANRCEELTRQVIYVFANLALIVEQSDCMPHHRAMSFPAGIEREVSDCARYGAIQP